MMTTIRMFRVGLLGLVIGMAGCAQPASDTSAVSQQTRVVLDELPADTT